MLTVAATADALGRSDMEDEFVAAKPRRGESWRDRLRVHAACVLFPELSPDELRDLGEDIKRRGGIEPDHVVVAWQPAGARATGTAARRARTPRWAKPIGCAGTGRDRPAGGSRAAPNERVEI